MGLYMCPIFQLGPLVGGNVGGMMTVGINVGRNDIGAAVVGTAVGIGVGCDDGSSVGTAVGIGVGCDDGSSVGTAVGIGVG